MRRLSVTFGGRWRRALAQLADDALRATPDRAFETRLAELSGHIRIDIGDRCLTAHMNDEPILPWLTAASRAVRDLEAGRAARIPFAASRHAVRIEPDGGALRLTISDADGRDVVRDAYVDTDALLTAIRSATAEVANAIAVAAPDAMRLDTISDLISGNPHTTAPETLSPLPCTWAPLATGPIAFGFILRTDTRAGQFGVAGPPSAYNDAAPVIRIGAATPVTGAFDDVFTFPDWLGAAIEALLKTRHWPQTRCEFVLDPSRAERLQITRDAQVVRVSLVHGRRPRDAATEEVSLATLASAARVYFDRLAIAVHAAPDGARAHERLRILRHAARRVEQWSGAVDDRPTFRAATSAPPTAQAATEMDITARSVASDSPRLPVEGLRHLAYRRRWHRTFAGLDPNRISVTSTRVLVGDEDGLAGLARDNGAMQWHHDRLVQVAAAEVEGLAQESSGALVLLDPESGRRKWRLALPGHETFVTAVRRSRGEVYVGTGDGHVVAIESNGRERWQFRSYFGEVTDIHIAARCVVMLGEDGFLYGLDRTTGAPRFTVPTDTEPVAGAIGSGAFVVVGHTTTSHSDAIARYDLDSGARHWSFRCHGHVAEAPTIVDDRAICLIVRGETAEICSIGLSDSAMMWRTVISGFGPSPVFRLLDVGRGSLCAVVKGESERVACIDPTSGHLMWTLPAEDEGDVLVDNPAPAACRGLVLIPGVHVRAVAPDDGRVIYTHSCDEIVPTQLRVWANGDLLVVEDETIAHYALGGHLALVE